MLDSRATKLAWDRIEIAVEERWTPLGMQASEITAEFAKGGGFDSSRMQVYILELYKNELDIQASMAWGRLREVLATVGVGQLDHLAVDLKAFMDDAIKWITSGLSDRLHQLSFFGQDKRSAIDPLKRLDEAKTHAIRKVHSEIDLFVAGLEQVTRRAQGSGDTHVNIYGGQVGILQTGASSTASMTVQLDNTSKQEIARTLDTVEKMVGEAMHVPFNRAEISEMARECKSELEKHEPNVSRLRSLMVGIATSIQTVASLRPAYDAIKGGLALIGVTLP